MEPELSQPSTSRLTPRFRGCKDRIGSFFEHRTWVPSWGWGRGQGTKVQKCRKARVKEIPVWRPALQVHEGLQGGNDVPQGSQDLCSVPSPLAAATKICVVSEALSCPAAHFSGGWENKAKEKDRGAPLHCLVFLLTNYSCVCKNSRLEISCIWSLSKPQMSHKSEENCKEPRLCWVPRLEQAQSAAFSSGIYAVPLPPVNPRLSLPLARSSSPAKTFALLFLEVLPRIPLLWFFLSF